MCTPTPRPLSDSERRDWINSIERQFADGLIDVDGMRELMDRVRAMPKR